MPDSGSEMGSLQRLVAVQDIPDIFALVGVAVGEEAALESSDHDVPKGLWLQVEFFCGPFQLPAYGGVRDQAIVRADGNGQSAFQHLGEGMIRGPLEIREGLEIAGQADLQGDSLAGDVLGKIVDVGILVSDPWMRSVANRCVP